MPKQVAAPLPVPTDPPPERGVLAYLGFEGCIRLGLRLDVERLSSELRSVPETVWGTANRGPVVFATIDSFYAIGSGPRSSAPSFEDREILRELPYLREVLHELIPGPPDRAIAQRVPAGGGLLPIHRDDAVLFRGTLRLSIQVEADGPQRFYSGGLWYDLAPGEVWVLDNLSPHGVKNSGAQPRISIVTDYRPTDALVRMLAEGDHGLGVRDDAALVELESLTRDRHRKYRFQGLVYGVAKRLRIRR
jgi:hypothetical protein